MPNFSRQIASELRARIHTLSFQFLIAGILHSLRSNLSQLSIVALVLYVPRIGNKITIKALHAPENFHLDLFQITQGRDGDLVLDYLIDLINSKLSYLPSENVKTGQAS